MQNKENKTTVFCQEFLKAKNKQNRTTCTDTIKFTAKHLKTKILKTT